MLRKTPILAALLILGLAVSARTQQAGAPQDSGEAVLHPGAPALPSGSADSIASGRPSAAGTDSAAQDTLRQKRLYEYTSNPFLQVAVLPVDMLLVPVVKGVIYPAKAPLRYFLDENVIDRTISLISIGEGDKVMLYPTLNLAPGTGSSTGLTFRHFGIFGRPTERLVALGNVYVNGDWKFRTYLSASELGGTGFNAKAAILFLRVKNANVNQPGTNKFWYYGDTSNVYSLAISHLLVEKLGARVSFVFRDNHYGETPTHEDSLQSAFFRNDLGQFRERFRGLDKRWYDRILALGIYRDTRNNENITLAGSDFRLDWNYHLTTAGHDYHGWQAWWTGYYKLGKEKYEISTDEERKAGPINVRKVLKKMEYQNLKSQLFNRKVVAFHAYAAQSFEVPGNHMPVYGLQTLGNDTPLRGYSGSRFRDYTVLSLGGEYRFPVMRLVDGIIFNEYGVYGRDWAKIDYPGSLKNSWGFGIRVRRPDIHLFRLQLGFHGTQGIQFNLSVDAPY